jgi:carboxyl-terminal processing protease
MLSGILVLSLVSGTLSGATPRDDADDDSLYKYLSVFTEVLRLVRQAYVDETEVDSLMAGALEGAPDALDPFSMYVPEEGSEPYLASREVGIGHSGVRIVKERGVAYVVAVQKGGPAAELGLQRGDIVSELNGESTRSLPLWEIEQTLAGPGGGEVGLEILRGGENRQMTLTLGEFSVPGPTVEQVDGVSLLRLTDFTSGTAAAVRELLSFVDGDSLLVDLRGLAWGDAAAAYDVAEIFARGELGRLVNRDGALETFSADGSPDWTGRIVVLVDRGCLGACEILAKVLREQAGAKLVGQSTFGFAGRSRIVDLRAGGSLVITEAFFTGADGEPLNQGLEPDLAVGDRSRSFDELDESLEDLTLDRALELLRSEGGDELRKAA